MTKEDALKRFYKNNKINPKTIHKKDRIAELPKMLDVWLSNIDTDDHSVFLEAFSRYTYLTQHECQVRFGTLVEMLENELQEHNIDLEEVIYVTVESATGIKSGSDNVRTDLQVYNFNKIDNDQVLAAQSKFSKEQLEEIKAVVFVDDIIGTGKTIWSEFYNFCKKYNLSGNNIPKLYYMCLSPTEKAIKHLNKNFKNHGYKVTAIYKEEWISSKAFKGDSEEYKIVDKYEKTIDDFFTESVHSYRMGFEKSCLLLSFYYNTPNNTISSFWRPTEFNKPPFLRKGKECKRPGISDLMKKKKESDANTYSFAINRSK